MFQLLRVSVVAGLAGLVSLWIAAALPSAAQACQPFQMTIAPLRGQTEVAVDGGILMMYGRASGFDRAPEPNAGDFYMSLDDQAIRPEVVGFGEVMLWRAKLNENSKVAIVRNQSKMPPLVFPIVAATTAMNAPVIKNVIGTTKAPVVEPPGPPRGGLSAGLAIHLSEALPDQAFGLAVFSHYAVGGVMRVDGVAFVPVVKGQQDLTYLGGGGGCGDLHAAIYIGATLSFSYVTMAGRLSPQSTPQVVVAVPPPAKVKRSKFGKRRN